jgi:hypothetical protein
MTNPFTIIVLRAIDSYNKVMSESPSQHTLSKGLFMFSLGTAIFATVMYKVTKTTTTPTTWSNFLSRFFNQYIVQSSKTGDDILFEDKYFKEYDEWIAAQDSSLAENTHPYVQETINDFYGDIIMCYDASIMSFVYYARTANIPYKYLETVSRKYMIETNAPRDIYIDIRKEYAKAKDLLTNKKVSVSHQSTHTDPDDDHKVEETDVFAKFKTYNTGSNLSNQKTTTATNTKTPSDTDRPNTSSTKIMRENSNRYSYRGKIEDYNMTPSQNTAAPTTAQAPANETYAEYKKRMNGGVPPRDGGNYVL